MSNVRERKKSGKGRAVCFNIVMMSRGNLRVFARVVVCFDFKPLDLLNLFDD